MPKSDGVLNCHLQPNDGVQNDDGLHIIKITYFTVALAKYSTSRLHQLETKKLKLDLNKFQFIPQKRILRKFPACGTLPNINSKIYGAAPPR